MSKIHLLIKKDYDFSVFFLTENLRHENSAEKTLVFSADLCYNGTNEKPRPLGEVAAKPTERAQLCAKNPLTRYRGSSPKGRAFGCARSSLGVWALPDAFVKQMRNLR